MCIYMRVVLYCLYWVCNVKYFLVIRLFIYFLLLIRFGFNCDIDVYDVLILIMVKLRGLGL